MIAYGLPVVSVHAAQKLMVPRGDSHTDHVLRETGAIGGPSPREVGRVKLYLIVRGPPLGVARTELQEGGIGRSHLYGELRDQRSRLLNEEEPFA